MAGEAENTTRSLAAVAPQEPYPGVVCRKIDGEGASFVIVISPRRETGEEVEIA